MPLPSDDISIAGSDWSREEVDVTVAVYFQMLTWELRRQTFNKAEQNRKLQELLPGRSRGAIEYKLANITAALHESGFPGIDGYKPRSNFQDLLREVVVERLSDSQDLEELIREAVTRPVEPETKPLNDVLSILVSAPKMEAKHKSFVRETPPGKVFLPRNYLEVEARNRSLGCAGELLVMEFEHRRLWCAGHKDLADRIEHVATKGQDYLGYDIASFETDGRERFIEVKTTRFGQLTPFFASRNEVVVSEKVEDFYHLYRLFKFRDAPKLFTLSGSLRRSCQLEPATYSAIPR